nr:hypothetical protein [uncultured Devosia sp.]
MTTTNVVAYSKAAIALSRRVYRLKDDGYGAIVVPSRGAVPVLHAAQAYYRAIVAPNMSDADRDANRMNLLFNPLVTELDMPFTADAGSMGVEGLTTAHILCFAD